MLISTLNCTTRVSILVFECHQLEIGASFNDTWQGDRVVKGGFLLPNLVEGVTPGGGGGGGRLGRLQTAGGTGPVNPRVPTNIRTWLVEFTGVFMWMMWQV